LVNALEQEKAQNRAGKIAEMLVKTDLLVLDELGYLPFSTSGGAMLFHLLSKLYERTELCPKVGDGVIRRRFEVA
jgi:DNA replication protein DnaC